MRGLLRILLAAVFLAMLVGGGGVVAYDLHAARAALAAERETSQATSRSAARALEQQLRRPPGAALTRAAIIAGVGKAPRQLGPLGAATLYISPSGSDSNPCSSSLPCQSFDRGYHAAAPGDTVKVRGGTYSSQTITFDSSKTSPNDVYFLEEAGQTAFINGDLLIGNTSGSDGPDHITIDGVDGNDGIGTRCRVDDITIQNVAWPVPVISGSTNVTIRNSEFGPAVNRVFNITDGGCGITTTDVLIEKNYFHDSLVTDYVNPPPNGYHSECMQQDLGATLRLTIRRNLLQNCQDFGILFNGGNTNLLVQGNIIDNPFQRCGSVSPACPYPNAWTSAQLRAATPRGGRSVYVACNPLCSSDVMIRNNVAGGLIVADEGNVNVTIIDNTGGGAQSG
jgi:hypothetical protein